MILGVRRELQEQLVREGYRLRVYIPFGTEWPPYFMRRLAERPATLWFISKRLGKKRRQRRNPAAKLNIGCQLRDQVLNHSTTPAISKELDGARRFAPDRKSVV